MEEGFGNGQLGKVLAQGERQERLFQRGEGTRKRGGNLPDEHGLKKEEAPGTAQSHVDN